MTRSPWSSPRRRYLAEDACELIEVDYDPQTAVVDYTRAAADTENVVHAGWGLESNAMVQVPFTPLSPDLDEVFASAAHVVECDVEQNRYVAMPMETRGIVASYHKGRDELDIVCATQSVHETRNFFARYLQIPEGNVHVTARDVGGGFGQKMFVYREECAVVLASYLLGRPVKWIEDRRENLLSAGHSRNEFAHVQMAVDADGIIQAITADHVCDVGAYAVCPAAMDPMLAPGPVQDARDSASRSRWCGPTPWARPRTAVRGCSRPPHARWRSTTPRAEIGIDPAEFAAPQPASPSTTCRSPRPSGNVFQEITPLETLEQALEILDYEAFRKEQAEARAEGRLPRRRASASYVEPTSMGSNTLATEAATVKVETSGRVVAYLGTTVARPEHRDHDGADRRRAPRRRLRRRHHRAGRLAVDAVRTRHRRQPHRGRRRRRRTRGDRRRAREGAERRRAHDGGRARRPRDRRGRRVGARDAVEVGDDRTTSPSRRCHRATSCPTRSERAGGDGPVPPDAVPHVVERDPHLRGRDRRRDLAARGASATSCPRTAAA